MSAPMPDPLLDPKTIITTIIAAFDRLPEAHQQSNQMVIQYDEEYNDLTHALELINFSGAEGYKLAKELQKNRTNRRRLKDHNQMLKPLVDLLKRNPKLVHEFKCCLNELSQAERNMEARSYRPRTQNPVFTAIFQKQSATGAEGSN